MDYYFLLPKPESVSPSGRGNGALAEHLRRPSARYEFLETARREPHVYDDPVPLRREKDKIYEELRATPETECSTLSATPSDPDSLKSCQSLPWLVPNSRLLRSSDFNSPRKPVRVEPPKAPDAGVCVPQSQVAASPPSTKSTPGMDFRLILIPETSKMLQFAVDRDTRLKSYLSKDASSPVTDGKTKFPVITEEEELKLYGRERDACIVPRDPKKVHQSEAPIKRGHTGKKASVVVGDPQRLLQGEAFPSAEQPGNPNKQCQSKVTTNKGLPGGQECIVSCDSQKLHYEEAPVPPGPAGSQDCFVSCDLQKLLQSETSISRGPARNKDQMGVVAPSVRVECQAGDVKIMNNLNKVNKITSWDIHKLKMAQRNIISVDENVTLRSQGTPGQKVTSVCYNNARVSSCGPKTSPTDTRTANNTCDDDISRDDNQKARDTNAGLGEESKEDMSTVRENDNPLNTSVTSLPLVHGEAENIQVPNSPGSGVPVVPLPRRHHSGNAINNNSDGSESRHHPYRTPLASIKRSYRSPTSTQLAAILDPMVRQLTYFH